MGSQRRVFTVAEVTARDTLEVWWIIIGGKVYDVSTFQKYHPGGMNVFIEATGRDATEDFVAVGHSRTARAMMNEMYVGDIVSSKQAQTIQQDNSPNFFIKNLQLLVILVLGFAVAFYTKSLS